MKNLLKNLILFLFFANLQNAFCYTLTSQELKNDVLAKITPQIKEQLKEYSSDFKINIQGISQNPIVTNETIKPKIEIILSLCLVLPVIYYHQYILFAVL